MKSNILAKIFLITSLSIIFFIFLPLYASKGKSYGEVVISEVVYVYDGDTFKVNINSWPPIIGREISIRVYGVDTPELKGGDSYTKDLALKAKLYTKNRLRNAKVITLKNIRRGKYFRIVADVYIDRWSLAKELIRVGLGKEYYGGGHPTW